MNTFDIDLFVIGAGSGGVRAARIAASLGATVAIAEDKYLGGTCVNVGCVPKKLFVYGSHFSEDFDTAKSYGWNLTQADFDWKKLLENKWVMRGIRQIKRIKLYLFFSLDISFY